MKKILFALTLFLITAASYSQSTKEMLKELENKWTTDENGNVLFTRTIEVPGQTKDELYKRALLYYKAHYGNAQAVTQTNDTLNKMVVRKAVFKHVHTGFSLMAAYVDMWHVLTIKPMDNKVELRLIFTEYEEEISEYEIMNREARAESKVLKFKVQDNYPINPEGKQKNILLKAFYKSYKAAMVSMDAIEKGLKE